MEFSEKITTPDKSTKKEAINVRKEAQDMLKRHERQLSQLQADIGDDNEAFEEQAKQATEVFKQELERFLTEHGEAALFQKMVKSLGKTTKRITEGDSPESGGEEL